MNVGFEERDRDLVLGREYACLGLRGGGEVDRQNIETLSRQPDTMPALAVGNGQNTVTNPISSTKQFFRLSQ